MADADTIDIVPNPTFKPDGLKAYFQALVKYQFNPSKPGPYTTTTKIVQLGKFGTNKAGGGAVAEKELLFKDGHGHVGVVPARDILNDFQYLCPVTIGTPGKVYNLNFDTGSSDLWLWSTELPSSTNTTGRHLYNKKKSKSFNLSPNSTWALSYNDKSYASGIVGTDIVSVGGLRVKKQSIELANNLSSSFQQNFGDGLLGLAFGTINRVTPVSVPTFPESLIAERNAPINKQVFTAYLTSYKDPKNLYGHSFYSFGHIVNKALGGQPINYVYSDNSQGLWQFQSTTATIGDQPISRFDNTAVADTGTSLMLLDDDFVDFMYNVIPGAYYDSDVQGFVYPTNLTDDQIPTIKIAVGDIEYEIRKADLAYADVGNGFTYGGIQSRGDLSFDVFGDTFLKSVYAIFDIGNSQFGVVPKKALGSNTSDSHHHPPHHHFRPPSHPVQNKNTKAEKTKPVVRRPSIKPRHAPSTDSPLLVRRQASDASSLLLGRGFSSTNKSTLAYSALLFFVFSFFSARGSSARILIAGVLCLFLLQ